MTYRAKQSIICWRSMLLMLELRVAESNDKYISLILSSYSFSYSLLPLL